MKLLNELVGKAERADAVASLMDGIYPHHILAIAEQFQAVIVRAEKAEARANDLENKLRDRVQALRQIIPDNAPCVGSPDFIWLQVSCDSGEPNVWPERAWDNVTWNDERIHNDDVLYVNASLIGKAAPEAPHD